MIIFNLVSLEHSFDSGTSHTEGYRHDVFHEMGTARIGRHASRE